VVFTWKLLPWGEDRLGLPEIHNHVPLDNPLNDTIDQLTLPCLEALKDALPFRFPDPLNDDLFGCLCSDSTEPPCLYL